MNFPRRQFIHLAAGAVVLPALSAHRALAQVAPDLASAFMQKYDVPALSFAVGYAGAIVHQDALGFADRENNEAVTPNHLFRIASVTKTITSVAIFTLIEQGRIKLTDTIFGAGSITGTDYGPPPYNSGVDQITLEHLLTHTAGGWANDNHDPMFTNLAMNQAQLITWTLKNRPLDNPPGQNFAYSNFGYCVLGRVIEKITGQPYADYVRAAVLNRCGVTDMTIGGGALAQRQPGEAGSAAYPGYAKGWYVNKVDHWWHDGSMPGTTTFAVRTHSGFCWAAFTSTRRPNSALEGDLDKLNWSMVGESDRCVC